ncbi:hypothetical protein APSETT444_003135 [Aspergillus pseudonomiae]
MSYSMIELPSGGLVLNVSGQKYCGKDCQAAHWPVHKLDCKNPIRKAAWRPAWEVENRVPHFIDDSDEEHAPVAMHGGSKYLWGNVPALDLLQLKNNEGEAYSQDLSLLLAASGDLRNLVKTVVSLPNSYRGRVHVDINDRDETVVARNLIFLLLYVNLKRKLHSFCERLHTLKLSICLFKQDAMDLPEKLATLRGRETFYDRIELANIADLGYLGPAKTLALFGPLLKARNENPKATLIMLFLNATREMSTPADQLASMPRAIETLQRFLPMRPRQGDPNNKYNAEFLNQMSAADLFTDNDTLFNRLVERARFKDMGRLLGLGMKTNNSIVAKWPMRLGDNPTQHEFEMAFWSGHTGCERYVEWHRVG